MSGFCISTDESTRKFFGLQITSNGSIFPEKGVHKAPSTQDKWFQKFLSIARIRKSFMIYMPQNNVQLMIFPFSTQEPNMFGIFMAH